MLRHRSIYLIASFAAFLSVTAVSAVAVWRNARQAQNQAAALHESDLRAHDAMAAIRSSVYLTAILTRDYLMDEKAEHVPEYVERFQAIQASAQGGFDSMDRAAQNQTQRAALDQLKTEVAAYLESTRVLVESTAKQRQEERTDILRQRIHKREEIFALAARIGQLTAENSAQERERMASADRGFRSSIGWIAGASLLLGLVISALTFMRMRALESQSEAAQTELRMLSVQIRSTQEEERKSLSRELHDQVGQMLTGLRMELAAISRFHADPSSEVNARLEGAKGTVEQTLSIVRNIAMLLRPSMLDDLGLTPALNWLVKEVSRSSGIAIRAEINPLVDELPDAHRTCLYRVVQEALTNANRHSGAGAIDLKVNCNHEWVQATIADDGKGFEPTDKRRGLGLLGMEERIRELGGNLHFISAPGRGTSVEIRLPRPASMEGLNAKNFDSGRSWDRPNRAKTTP